MEGVSPYIPSGGWWAYLGWPIIVMVVEGCGVSKSVGPYMGTGSIQKVTHCEGPEEKAAFVKCSQVVFVGGVVKEEFHKVNILRPDGREWGMGSVKRPSNPSGVRLHFLDP